MLIAVSPILFYSYKFGLFPSEKTWQTAFFTMESHYFENVMVFFWTFFGKLIPLYLLLIWFFTCRYWWYWAIAVPIGMYAFQIVSLFNDEFLLKDEPIDLLFIFPFILVISVALVLIRKRVKIYIDAFNLKEKLEQKLSEL